MPNTEEQLSARLDRLIEVIERQTQVLERLADEAPERTGRALRAAVSDALVNDRDVVRRIAEGQKRRGMLSGMTGSR